MPLLKLAFGLSVSLAVSAALTSASLALFIPAFLVAGALSQSWNGLSFTATAELAGRSRAGAALGFQQTALAVASGLAPPLFALPVESTSWSAAFALAAKMVCDRFRPGEGGVFRASESAPFFVTTLRAALGKAAQSDQFKAALANVGQELAYLDGPDFQTFWDIDGKRTDEAVISIGRQG